MRKEFDIVFYALSLGLGFVWLGGFAVGYQDNLLPLILFGLAVAAFTVGRRLR